MEKSISISLDKVKSYKGVRYEASVMCDDERMFGRHTIIQKSGQITSVITPGGKVEVIQIRRIIKSQDQGLFLSIMNIENDVHKHVISHDVYEIDLNAKN